MSQPLTLEERLDRIVTIMSKQSELMIMLVDAISKSDDPVMLEVLARAKRMLDEMPGFDEQPPPNGRQPNVGENLL